MSTVHISLLILATALPLFAYADVAPCAPNALWISRETVVENESVTFYTIVHNNSGEPQTKAVTFEIDGSIIGDQHVQMNAGEPAIASVTWKAAAGVHSLSAHASSAHASTSCVYDPLSFSVAAAPPPSAAAHTASNVASALQEGVRAAKPTVLNISSRAFVLTEHVRSEAIAAVEKKLAQSPVSSEGEVLSASDPSVAAVSSSGSLLSNIWNKILRGALMVLRIQILFYGLMALVLYIMLRLFMTWLRERRRSRFARG
ncbi:MAG: hypothetical protein G01um10148_949 [Parcubacteria group bacterium Gr01-1014_8]|nr:MAG: hypothetical protein G01um10148_949 [Parcubacteria group bacterium Gr01-1014_8]